MLDGAPEGWVARCSSEGELALLADGGGLDAISELAHRLDLVTVPLLRGEQTPEQQAATVMRLRGLQAARLGRAGVRRGHRRSWAHERGPMTLLVETGEP